MDQKLLALTGTLIVAGGFLLSDISKRSFGQQNLPQSPRKPDPSSAEPPLKKDCEPPTAWQNVASSSALPCNDAQSPQVGVNQGVVSVSFCGYAVWSFIGRTSDGQVDHAFNERYKSTLTKWVRLQVGSRICCDKFQDAIRRSQPCDPRVDVDCDGKQNGSDSVWSIEMGASLPDINIFRKPQGAAIDRFPPGFDPDDPNFMPPYDKCDCKWELMKGTLTCSPDGKQPHVYQARWRCPATGKEQVTRKEAPASAPCSKP
jgi:hypothetical protein